MENKVNPTDEMENIADYYADTENEATEDDTPKRVIISDPDMYANEGYTMYIPKRRYNGNLIADIGFIAAVMVVSIAVLLLSHYLGTLGVKDPVLVEAEYLRLLDSSSKYNDTVDNISAINEEIEELTRERDLKQSEYDALISYRNGIGTVEDYIAQLQAQLDTLNAENQKKQAEIDALTSGISDKVSTIMNLSPGIYTVGESIAAGKYTVTGSGSILVSSSNGAVKLNTILTADGVTVILNDSDRIQLDTRAKFSPAA